MNHTLRPLAAAVICLFIGLLCESQAAFVESRVLGNTAYFIQDAPGRVDRYDMASRQWISSITLPAARGNPTTGHVDSDGLYLAYGTSVYRYALDGANEVHLVNATTAVKSLHTDGNVLFVNHSDSMYARLISINKTTNAQITTFENYIYTLGGASIAPGANKIFGRTLGVSPSDLSYVTYNDNGTFVSGGDSPYHGDYPSATATWVFPDSGRVVDSAGIVYSTGDQTYAGSLGGAVNQIAFLGTNLPIVLRGSELLSFNAGLLPVGSKSLGYTPSRIFVNQQDVLAFTVDATQTTALRVNAIPLTDLSAPTPGQPLNPAGLPYSPDYVFEDNAGNICLFSKTNLSVFRWNIASQQYTTTIPLLGIPSFATFSASQNRLYLAYPTGLIRKIEMSDPTLAETPFCALPSVPQGLAMAGDYLFSVDDSGAWVSHYTFNSVGTQTSVLDWNYYSTEYIWSAANQRMYFFRDDSSPNDIHSEPIAANGVIGTDNESPLHDSTGFVHPIRISPDGTRVVLGSGVVHDGTTLARLTSGLANAISDAAWTGGNLQTMRTITGVTQFQAWNGANYAAGAVKQVPGTAHRLIALSDGRLFAVTLVNGIPSFYVLDSSFNVIAPPTLAVPTGLSAAITGANQITLSWNDVAGEQDYLVERRVGTGGTWGALGTAATSATQFQDAGFTVGTSYFYRVTARNGAVISAPSAEIQVIAAAPSVPTGLSATKQASQQIMVRWNDTPNESSYLLERKTGAAGTWSQINAPTAGTTSYLDSSLALATQYYYRIRATNAIGTSLYSAEADATTDVPLPSAPTLSTPSAPNYYTVNLSWTNVSYETAYVIERTSAGGPWTTIASPAANVTSYADTTVLPLTSYSYRIKATNLTGDSPYSAIGNVSTPNITPPAAPTSLVARPLSASSVLITWNDVAFETGYRIERRGDSPAWTAVASLAPNTTTYTDTDLVQGMQYFYRVFAVNAGGDSSASNTDEATPLNYRPWLVDDFDPELAPIWTSVTGGVPKNGPAGFLGSNALWFGQIGTRAATTIPVNVTDGGIINFKLRAGNGAADGTENWDDSEAGETVSLEYSLNGTNWTTLQSLNTVAPNFSTWQNLSVEIPVGARGIATQFRWRQLAHSGAALDTWALEDVELLVLAPPLLSGPAAILATPNSATQVTLMWTSVPNALQYVIERFIATEWTQVAVVPASTPFAVLSELSPSTFYSFRIRAANPAGISQPSTESLVRTWDSNDTAEHPGTFIFKNTHISANEGSHVIEVEVLRLDGSSIPVAVSYTSTAGSAEAESDFSGGSGVIEFGPGETSKVIEIPIISDVLIEGTEDFSIALSSPTNGSRLGGIINAEITIVDDDHAGSLAFEQFSSSTNEGNSLHLVRVRRTNGDVGPVSVSYSVNSGGTAQEGADFTLAAGVLDFAHGETEKDIFVQILDDDLSEVRERFSIVLSDAVGALLGARREHMVEILDDEGVDIEKSSYIGLVKNVASGKHAGIVTFSVTRSGAVTGKITTGRRTLRFLGKLDANGQLVFTQMDLKRAHRLLNAPAPAVTLTIEPSGNAFAITCEHEDVWLEGTGERCPAPGAVTTKPVIHTMVMNGSLASGDDVRGIGRLRLAPTGSTISGRFPNGIVFSGGIKQTISDRIPFMAIAESGDVSCGWLEPGVSIDGPSFEGVLDWDRAANEFVELDTEVRRYWTAPGQFLSGFARPGNADLISTGSDGEPRTLQVTNSNVYRVKNPLDGSAITLTVDASGIAYGKLTAPKKPMLRFNGVILRDAASVIDRVEGLWTQGPGFGTWELLPLTP